MFPVIVILDVFPLFDYSIFESVRRFFVAFPSQIHTNCDLLHEFPTSLSEIDAPYTKKKNVLFSIAFALKLLFIFDIIVIFSPPHFSVACKCISPMLPPTRMTE